MLNDIVHILSKPELISAIHQHMESVLASTRDQSDPFLTPISLEAEQSLRKSSSRNGRCLESCPQTEISIRTLQEEYSRRVSALELITEFAINLFSYASKMQERITVLENQYEHTLDNYAEQVQELENQKDSIETDVVAFREQLLAAEKQLISFETTNQTGIYDESCLEEEGASSRIRDLEAEVSDLKSMIKTESQRLYSALNENNRLRKELQTTKVIAECLENELYGIGEAQKYREQDSTEEDNRHFMLLNEAIIGEDSHASEIESSQIVPPLKLPQKEPALRRYCSTDSMKQANYESGGIEATKSNHNLAYHLNCLATMTASVRGLWDVGRPRSFMQNAPPPTVNLHSMRRASQVDAFCQTEENIDTENLGLWHQLWQRVLFTTVKKRVHQRLTGNK